MSVLYVIGASLLAAFLGSIFGGVIEDAAWIAGGEAIPNCDTIKDETMKENCKKINETYYKTKGLYQAIGGISPLVIGAVVILKTQ